MSINGLSNQLCLVVATIITLLVESSLFRSACATTDSHEFTDSRQFRKNLAVSRYRNNTPWMPNYSWKPLEKYDGPRRRPIWETEQEVETEEDKKKRALFEEWDRKMRQVTKEQRKKRKSWSRDKGISSDKTSTSSSEDLEHTTEVTEPTRSVTEQLDDSSIEVHNTLHNGKWSLVAANKSTGPTKANRIRYNAEKPVGENFFPKGRWGMSIREPPKEFLTEIARSPNLQRSHLPSEQERPEPSSKRSNNREKTTTRSSVVVTFPPGRWGIDVKNPPPEFLQEMSKKLLTLKINSQAEEEAKNEGPEKNAKVYDIQDQRGHRRTGGTEETPMELPVGSSNGQWSMSKGSSPRKFLRGIQTYSYPKMVAFQKTKNSHQLIVDPIHDPPFQQSTPFQNSLLYKMLLSPQSLGIMDVPMVPTDRDNPNPIVPSMRCIICQT